MTVRIIETTLLAKRNAIAISYYEDDALQNKTFFTANYNDRVMLRKLLEKAGIELRYARPMVTSDATTTIDNLTDVAMGTITKEAFVSNKFTPNTPYCVIADVAKINGLTPPKPREWVATVDEAVDLAQAVFAKATDKNFKLVIVKAIEVVEPVHSTPIKRTKINEG